MLPALQFRSLPPAVAPHFGVVAVVAFLAQRSEVQKARRLWPVIEYVRRRQNHFAARYRVRLAVLRAAPLAAVLGSVDAHEQAPQLPVCRVARLVLRSYRHRSSNPAIQRDPSAASRLRAADLGL
jgi:hypothetical protein